MKIISNNSEQSHLKIINENLENSDQVIICVAFLKMSGLNLIISKLKSKVGKCKFYIGTDFYLTEPTALRKLFNDGHSVYITKISKSTYHPKIFYFKKNNSISILIGSANVTSGGFLTNLETSLAIDTSINSSINNEFEKLIISFENHSNLIENDEIISDYEKRFDAYRKKHLVADEEFEIELQKIIELENERENLKKIKEEEQAKKQNQNSNVNSNDNLNENKNNSSKNYKAVFRQDDYTNFEIFLPIYIEYKKNERTSGVVNKNTKHVELLKWYERIKELIKDEALPDDLIKRLIEVGFPIGNGRDATLRMIWDKRFEELVEFKNNEQKHLDFTYCTQTKNKKSQYYSIGGWCAQQKLRRKGLETPEWDWDYEEEKMKSLNYLWESPIFGYEPDDEGWYGSLLELDKYYNDKNNYKTVPNQKTYIGGWLNEQMTAKNTGSRQKEKKFLSPLREELLGELLKNNGVEWKWQEQKEREGLEKGILLWRELTEWESKLGSRKPTKDEITKFKPTRDWITGTRFRSKKWNKVKDKWKFDYLMKMGFPLPIEKETNE